MDITVSDVAKQKRILIAEKKEGYKPAVTLDPTKLTLIRTLVGHSGVIRAIAFSPDGHILASSSSDMTIKLWNPSTGQFLHTLSGHERNVSSIALTAES